MDKIYDLEMTVPLGIRHGSMVLREEPEGKVSGTIDILGSKTPFTGRREGTKLYMDGILKTRIRNVHYQGQGTLIGDCMEMKIQDKEKSYRLSGKERKER